MATGYYLLDNRVTFQYGYPRRNGAVATGTIILHDAEGGTDLVGEDATAENVANYIKNRTTRGSYHRLVDRDTRIKLAPIDCETWHSIPDNPWSVGICVAWNKADLATMTYEQRRSYYVPLAREVLDVRAEFADRGIAVPIGRMLTAAETQARKPGVSTHSRTDPSRRTDPFGTGSMYEAEFLAVLAELATTPASLTVQEDDMKVLATDGTSPDVWIGDGVTRRRIATLDTLTATQWLIDNDYLSAKTSVVQTIPDLWALGHPVDVTADQLLAAIQAVTVTLTDEQVAALAAILGPELAGHVIGAMTGGTNVSTIESTVSTVFVPLV